MVDQQLGALSLACLRERGRQHLSRLPSIDPAARTLLVTGFPNVGKSSFVNRVTRADVEVDQVQPYAFFTTTSLLVGHTPHGLQVQRYQRWLGAGRSLTPPPASSWTGFRPDFDKQVEPVFLARFPSLSVLFRPRVGLRTRPNSLSPSPPYPVPAPRGPRRARVRHGARWRSRRGRTWNYYYYYYYYLRGVN